MLQSQSGQGHADQKIAAANFQEGQYLAGEELVDNGSNAPGKMAAVKILFVLLLFGLFAFAGPEKLDPMLRAILFSSPESQAAILSLYGQETAAEPKITVFVELSGEEVPFGVHPLAGNVAVATLTFPQILELAAEPGVVRLWASRLLEPLLDRSVPEVGAPALWYGSANTTGDGVIVGLVDTGVDILHPAFRLDLDGDGTLESSRILFYWDQTAAGVGWFPNFWGDESGERLYGRVYFQRDLEAALQGNYSPVPDTHGHGTHVAGIAAGSGPVLRGVAPGADLVVVKTNFYEDGVVDGIKFVFEAAEALGKPAVVNISLGGHAGPHDGQGPFEQAVSGLVVEPGQVIVAAAGNEGNAKIHVGEEVTGPTTWTVRPAASSVIARFWYELPAKFQVFVTTPAGETILVPPGAARDFFSSSGTGRVDNTIYPQSSTQQIFFFLSGAAQGSTWHITFYPVVPGRVDGWLESSSMGQFLEGNGERTIAEPGNAERVITVGAYVTKVEWDSQAGRFRAEGYALGQLAPFSSRGPTRDGRLKPDLSAPGAWIASARSRDAQVSPWYALPDGLHMVLAGTSMAAPHVAGACALLLSRHPSLTWEEILSALRAGAVTDSFTGSVPNTSWGHGKLDIPGAWASLTPTTPTTRPWLVLLTNPASTTALFQVRLPKEISWAELRIYDLLGRLVWQTPVPLGADTIRWDLSTTTGFSVASGLYVAILVTSQGASDPIRVVVSR